MKQKTARVWLLRCSVAAWAWAIFVAVAMVKRPHYWPLLVTCIVMAYYLTWIWSVLRHQKEE